MTEQNSAPSRQKQEPRTPGIIDTYAAILTHVIPLLDQIKGTIEESTRKIPGAATQLQSVTKDTESATMEILNVLDTMTGQINAAESGMTAVRSVLAERESAMDRFGSQLKAFLDGGAGSPDGPAVRRLWQELAAVRDTRTPVAAVGEALESTKRHAMDIAMALQVQDITSQKIAGVHHMIESIREQLAWVLDHLHSNAEKDQGGPGGDGEKNARTEQRSFDDGAQFTSSTDRQDRADEIVQHWNKGSHERA